MLSSYDIDTPRGRHWAAPALVGAVAAVMAVSAEEQAVWSTLLFAIAVLFLVWALVNLGHHLVHIVWGIVREDRELSFKQSENFYAEQIAGMTPEQLKAMRAGKPIFDMIPGEQGRVDKLFGYEAYELLLWYMLVKSNNERVYPINNFHAETYHFDPIGDHAIDDYHQARNVTGWLVWHGFAEWGTGNQSASWKKPYGPDKVLAMLGLDRQTYVMEQEG